MDGGLLQIHRESGVTMSSILLGADAEVEAVDLVRFSDDRYNVAGLELILRRKLDIGLVVALHGDDIDSIDPPYVKVLNRVPLKGTIYLNPADFHISIQ